MMLSKMICYCCASLAFGLIGSNTRGEAISTLDSPSPWERSARVSLEIGVASPAEDPTLPVLLGVRGRLDEILDDLHESKATIGRPFTKPNDLFDQKTSACLQHDSMILVKAPSSRFSSIATSVPTDSASLASAWDGSDSLAQLSHGMRIPEPASIALLLIGFVGWSAGRRLQKSTGARQSSV